MSEVLIRPRRGKKDPEIGPVAIMAAMEKDLNLLRRNLDVKGRPLMRLQTSKVFKTARGSKGISIVGPVLGAPQAVLVFEKLIALGVRKIIFLGWCGSFQEEVQIGDLLIPDRGVIGEGTSGYYSPAGKDAFPDEGIVAAIEDGCTEAAASFHKGPVWSTDAPYRETKKKVVSLKNQGVLGVDMELSALLTVGRFRRVEVGALLVVSDELGSLKWRPGFSSKKV